MGERLEVDMIVKAIAEGFDKVQKDVAGIGDATEKPKKAFGGFADTVSGALLGINQGLALAGKAAELFKKGFEFAEEGASIQQTADSFDGLIQRAGVSADLLEQLDEAALGTVDSMTLMSSTLTLAAGTSGELQSSLLDATPELMEIAKAANKLNPSLGDTAHMYESIATGIKRASPMILDNLGLTIKVGEANDKYAAILGKTAEELTAEEKQMALLNAALEAGDTLIEQVGGTTESTTDVFAEFRKAIKDSGDELKTSLLPVMSNVVVGTTAIMTGNKKATDALDEHNKVVSESGVSYAEYTKEMERAANAAGYYINQAGNLVGAQGQLVRENFLVSESQREVNRQVDIWAAESGRYQGAADAYAESLITVTDAAGDQLYTMDELNGLISGKLGKETEDYIETQESLRQKMGDVNGEIAVLKGQGYSEQSEKVIELRNKYAELEDQITENADEHEEATKRMLFDLLTQQAAVDGLTADEMTFLNELAGPNGWGLIDEATATASENAVTALDNINAGVWTADEALGIFKDNWNSLSSKEITLTTYYNNVGQAGAGQTDNVGGIAGTGIYVHGQRAAGGPTFAGGTYLVGERGPEVLTMPANGNVTPNNAFGDMSAKLDEVNSSIDRLNRTLPKALLDAVMIAGASSGR